MVYYKDYRLTIIETDGKYTLYDAKYGGRAVHQNKTKEWTDDYIQRVSKLRGRKNLLWQQYRNQNMKSI